MLSRVQHDQRKGAEKSIHKEGTHGWVDLNPGGLSDPFLSDRFGRHHVYAGSKSPVLERITLQHPDSPLLRWASYQDVVDEEKGGKRGHDRTLITPLSIVTLTGGEIGDVSPEFRNLIGDSPS